MRLLTLFSLAIPFVSSGVLAAQSSDDSRFQHFHSQALSKTPLKLDDASYEDLTSGARNFSAAILLTALEPRFQCQLCREFQPEWDLLAKSWLRGDKKGESALVFGTLDFVDGKNAFQRLNLQTAPVLLLFQPSIGPDAVLENQPLRFDFSTGSPSVDKTHAWVSRHLPAAAPKPPIVRPVNYIRLVTITTIAFGLLTFLSVASPYLLPLIQNRNLWAAVSLILILLFTSGHMFNHIRKVPYVGGDGRDFFAGGFSNQFGLETQIIAAIYGLLSFATITLALKVPRMADPRRQQVAVWLWSAVMLGTYSFLLSTFRIKNGGYPFWLPPF